MEAKEFVKKYGVYIAGGAVVLYLVLKNTSSGARASTGASVNPLELAKLQQQGAIAASQLDLQKAALDQQLALAQLKAQSDAQARADAIALANRQLSIQQQQGMLNTIANAIKGILQGITGGGGSQSKGGASGGAGGGMGTPPIAGAGAQRSLPAPVAPNLGPSIYNPPYTPSYPEVPDYIPLNPSDWGSAPDVSSGSTAVDSGYTFSDQGNFYGGDLYGNAIDWSGAGSGDVYSGLPEVAIPPAGQEEGVPAEQYLNSENYILDPNQFVYDYNYTDYSGGDYG